MKKDVCVALDVMGGDHGPSVVVPAAAIALVRRPDLVFRLYGEEESLDEGDLRSTRKFLDLRGLLEAKDFDTFVQQASTPA